MSKDFDKYSELYPLGSCGSGAFLVVRDFRTSDFSTDRPRFLDFFGMGFLKLSLKGSSDESFVLDVLLLVGFR